MKKFIVAGLVLSGAVALSGCSIPQKQTVMKPDEAKDNVVSFVKDSLVQPGTEVEAKSIVEESGLYKVSLAVGTGKDAQNIETYVTKDGSTFFPQAMNVEETKKKQSEARAKENEPPKEVAKSDVPVVDLYLMSFCPFGNKAEDTIQPAYELLKDKVTFNFRYIVSTDGETIQSLRGESEVVQNEREACVMRDYGKDKWMAFVTYVNEKCGEKGECWEEGVKSLGMNVAKVAACVEKDGKALMEADAQASEVAGAQGSPTMLVNGTETKAVYQYGNSEAYKAAICAAFNTPPAECETTLPNTAPEGGVAAGAAAACGN